MRARLFAPLGALVLLAASGLLAAAPPAGAAGETVSSWLTTDDAAAGRHVVRGLQQQAQGSRSTSCPCRTSRPAAPAIRR